MQRSNHNLVLTTLAIFNKITNVNKTMIASGRKDIALNPGQESTLQQLRVALQGSGPVPANTVPIVVKIVTEWPYSDRLAGLDILRCIAPSRSAAKYTEGDDSLLDIAIASSLPSGEAPNENAVMMGCRTTANLFGSAEGRALIGSNAEKVIDFLERVAGIKGEAIGKFNRNVLIATTTCSVNLSVLANREKALSPDHRRRLGSILVAVLQEQQDSEVLYRAVVALGTLLTAGKEAKASGMAALLDRAAQANSEDRVKSAAAECRHLL